MNRRGFLRSAALAALPLLGGRALRGAAGSGAGPRELAADILVAGGSLGAVAAALAAVRRGRTVILTEETGWIGGQATTQGVPLDEHPWAEKSGCTASYREFRRRVRDFYRTNGPLIPAARADPLLNPGAGWASPLHFEPRVGLLVLQDMLAPHVAAGRLRIFLCHRPVCVATEGDVIRAVSFRDEESGHERVITAALVLDGTELGDLLPLADAEHVIGAESQRETGEPSALEGAADPRLQNPFTHVFALEHRPGEEHVIDRPRDYDFWRARVDPMTKRAKIPVDDLFARERDHYGKPIRNSHAYRLSTWAFRRAVCQGNFQADAAVSDVTMGIWLQNAYDLGPLTGVTTEEQARHLASARQLSLSVVYWLQTEAPDAQTGRGGFPGLRLRGDIFGTKDGLAPFPYIREARRLRAGFIVREQDFRREPGPTEAGPVKYADSVGVSGYRVDIARLGKSGRPLAHENHGKHWRQQIPLGALIPVRLENLLAAGKCLGVTSVMNGAFRVHPTEWNIGESAGALAAYCLERKATPRQVRGTPEQLRDFQRELVAGGVELDWPENDFARSYFSQISADHPDWYHGEAWRLPAS